MLTIFSSFLFFIFAVSKVFFWVKLWQLKEYRLDRLLVHLKDTREGKQTIFSYESFILFAFLILYIPFVLFDSFIRYFSILIFALFLLLGIRFIRQIWERKIKRPVFTIKAISITCFSLLVIFFGLFLPLTDLSLWFIILSLLIPWVVAFFVYLLAFPTEIYTDFMIQKALIKRKTLKKLVVIAVSGSYGKSSTKEVVAHILSQKFSVVKTSFSQNTPLSIAKKIIQDINSQTDFFVVELGAYKKGEIAQLAAMTLPTISITTAISDQHLALYGNMESVSASEMELIQALPRNALSLLAKNSTAMRAFGEKIKGRKVLGYGSKVNTRNIQAKNIMPSLHGLSWEYKYKNKTMNISSFLLGIHTVENILPAVFLGNYFGMSDKEIIHGIKTLKPLPKTMEKISLHGILAIDDTFNASPESVMAAINFLSLSKERKILVMAPIIELGKTAVIRHEEIGKALSKVDMVFLTNNNFLKQIEKGLRQTNTNTTITVGSYQTIASFLKSILKKGDTIVFEGKEAGIVLKMLQ